MVVDLESKYRPKWLDEYVFPNASVEEMVRAYGKGDITRPLILWGSHGTGKSLLAELIPKQIEGFMPIIAHVKGVEFKSKKEVLAKFTHNKSFDALFVCNGQKFNYNVLEEFDFDNNASKAMRVALEEHRGVDITIITTNEIWSIDVGVQSRCEILEVPAVEPQLFLQRAKEIIASEGFDIDESALLNALDAAYQLRAENRSYYKKLEQLLRSV